MSRLECDSCGDLIDVSWRTTTLPYICVRCEKDSALAIEQDVWEAEYVGPACFEEKDNIPCDAPYNSGVPCQSALDSVQAEAYDIQDHNADVLDQFDEDTDIINDVREQLDEAHAANVRLTEEIEFCDRRVRAYQQVAAEADKFAMENEKEIRRLKELLDKNSQGIHLRHLELRDENASLRSMLKDKTREAKTYELAYERASRSLWERITDWFE